MKILHLVIAVVGVVVLGSVVEYCAIEHGIDGKAIQAYIGIVGAAIGALSAMLIRIKKEK